MAVAYLLDPVVDRLERLRIGRGVGTFLVLLGFFALATGLLLLLIPLLSTQVERLVSALPGYVDLARNRLAPLLEHLNEDMDRQAVLEKVTGMTGDLVRWAGGVLGRLISGGVARSEEHTSELLTNAPIVCRLLLEKKNKTI